MTTLLVIRVGSYDFGVAFLGYCPQRITRHVQEMRESGELQKILDRYQIEDWKSN